MPKIFLLRIKYEIIQFWCLLLRDLNLLKKVSIKNVLIYLCYLVIIVVNVYIESNMSSLRLNIILSRNVGCSTRTL